MQIEERSIRLKNFSAKMRVLEAGRGDPVVLLHGNPDNADEWRAVIKRLAGEFRCLAPDLPGYGKSARLPASFRYSIAEQIAFLDAVLAACRITGPVLLVVHDIGAMMGVPWAGANLPRLRALLITNTVAFQGFHWFRTAQMWGNRSLLGRLRASLLMLAIGLRGGARFRTVFGAQNPQLQANEIERITRSFALNLVAKKATLRQFREVLKPDFFAGFDEINRKIAAAVPMQVLWGDGDPYLPTPNAMRFGTECVRVLPGVGHWPPIVAPDEVAGAIRALAMLAR